MFSPLNLDVRGRICNSNFIDETADLQFLLSIPLLSPALTVVSDGFSLLLILLDLLQYDISCSRFLVLCQYKMPGTFTVKAGFALPGQLSPDTGLADPGELEAVEPEYYEDFLPGLNNNNNYDNLNNNNNYDDFLTSLSHNSIDSSVLAAPEDHWASQRRSRTFSTNLFGSREVGGEARSLGDGGDKGGSVKCQL